MFAKSSPPHRSGAAVRRSLLTRAIGNQRSEHHDTQPWQQLPVPGYSGVVLACAKGWACLYEEGVGCTGPPLMGTSELGVRPGRPDETLRMRSLCGRRAQGGASHAAACACEQAWGAPHAARLTVHALWRSNRGCTLIGVGTGVCAAHAQGQCQGMCAGGVARAQRKSLAGQRLRRCAQRAGLSTTRG